MNGTLIVKVLIGAVLVLMIHLVARTRSYYVAALIPLFPSFGLIAYYTVGRMRGVGELRSTVLFGMLSLVPYLVFLITLYLSVHRVRLAVSLLLASASWLIVSVVLVLLWPHISPADGAL